MPYRKAVNDSPCCQGFINGGISSVTNEVVPPQLLSELKEVNIASNSLITINYFPSQPKDFVLAVEKVCEALERAVITSRNTLERLWLYEVIAKQRAQAAPYENISGTVRVLEYNWLHIKLNSLLPHCRFQTPVYLGDTIKRLLDAHTAKAGRLPYHENALLIIDEHCNIKNRNSFDQDNKGWRAVSNALKGRVFPDDDQFSLGVALVSARSEKPACNIFIIDALDAGNFFNMRSSGSLYW